MRMNDLKEDILNEARTMYTLDMAKQNGVPRAGLAEPLLMFFFTLTY